MSSTCGIGVLGGDLEMAADVVLRPAPRMYSGERRARSMRMPLATRTFLMPGSVRALLHQLDERAVIGAEQFADRRMDAGQAPAHGFDFGLRAASSGTCWRWGRRCR